MSKVPVVLFKVDCAISIGPCSVIGHADERGVADNGCHNCVKHIAKEAVELPMKVQS